MAQIEKTVFGETDGRPVGLFTLENANGLRAQITNYGATLVSLETPDRNGQCDDITLGYDDLERYLSDRFYFGSIVGRCSNRITNGRFSLDGQTYQLSTNAGADHLHGGIKGFGAAFWDAEPQETLRDPAVALAYTSPDGEENYPGRLICKVTYTLTNTDELVIDYEASTDKPTIVNLTHHSYFNLAGQGAGDILGHEMMLNADCFLPVGSNVIPIGELRPVAGTPFDFTKSQLIGRRINDNDEQLTLAGGYDHTWVLQADQSASPVFAARVVEPASGRIMEVHTTEPGVHFYAGNFLEDNISGKKGRIYGKRAGLCLETQHFPDAPNKPHFPSIVLHPGQTYTQKTIYKFYAE